MSTVSLDYTSRDFDGFKQSLLDYAAQAFPEWVPGSEGDFGVLMIELLAYVGDVNSYYIDRAQTEAYLPTATQASSVLQIAQLLGYQPGTGAPARGTLVLQSSTKVAVGAAPDVLVPAGTKFATAFMPEIDGQIIFETDNAVVVPGGGGTVTVAVTEGETKKDAVTGGPILLAEATGLPDQVFRITTPRVYVETVQIYVGGQEWRMVPHLLDADPNDQVFEVFNDDKGYTSVRFGDGLNGAIPAVGLPVTTVFRVGYGAKGNLAAGKVTSVYGTAIQGVTVQQSAATSGVSTSSVMTGGADPETTEQIRNNAPKTFFTQQRAVTTQDFENFAVSVPGVSKASAVADFFSSVTVYIVGPDGGTPSTLLKDQVTRILQAKALAGVTVTVASPSAVAVNVGSSDTPVAIEVWPNYARTAVQFNVEQAIKARLAFTSVDLGMKLTVSDLYKTVMAVDGVRYAAVPLMARADAVQTGTADIQFQTWEYPTAGSVIVSSTGGIG